MCEKAPFRWQIENAGKEWRLRVEGELDFGGAPELRKLLKSCIDHGGRELRLDLSAVTFFDSEAVKAILAVTHDLDEKTGSLRVTAASPAVQRVLSILGLDTLLETPES